MSEMCREQTSRLNPGKCAQTPGGNGVLEAYTQLWVRAEPIVPRPSREHT
jgi:hypothetical protein